MQFFIILFPIFCIFIVGFIAQKILKFDVANLSKMSLYVLSPFLAFKTFYTHTLTTDYLFYVMYIFGLCLSLVAIVSIWSVIMKYSTKERCAMILSSCFMNNGNYGTPVLLVFFGAVGFDLGVIMMVLQQFVMSTVGIYYAAKGSSRSDIVSQKDVINKVIRMPVAYGALLGIIFQLCHIPLSKSIMTSINMIGDSSIVVIMIILGMQLAKIHIKQLDYPKLSFSLITRMVISPIVASIMVYYLPILPVYKQVLVVLAAMPSAANTTLMSVQFDTHPELVSSATLVSTLLSLITLPIVLSLVGAPVPV
ncbi:MULTISPECIES: AEC family transporter [unclassified Gilliamella]|uniref:AEC family transporter n=1 Tax=unclassified Gilliamella TaxID=2685620 RepID=UPI001C6A8134|nr:MULTISPECIES: AEC family transporter [unclassified Gilliamella]MCX8601279.1 AEC family transporter [Gilliamella sp. B3722]MCX8607433.1 AEC family transporter [Gilliamella sp. B3771]MCX8610378.1 AEC family transporter [Gilliamella sp. B3891]MCX8612953.1 AEC family transporter [Gilliamella sp. B3773]MCX8614862.1 AEC family transporter [Gilliamella sp. B3770]